MILSVGGLNEGKGHHRIVEILPSLLRHRPDLLYAVVGTEHPGDTVRPVLERMVQAARLEKHVSIVGARPHHEIPLWMAAADVFCLASRSEGWANVLLEALACGRPVVSTRVGGNPEIIERDSLGILVPPADDEKLARGILDALDRAWDTDAMIEHARAYSWERAALSVVETFHRVVPPATMSGVSLAAASEERR